MAFALVFGGEVLNFELEPPILLNLLKLNSSPSVTMAVPTSNQNTRTISTEPVDQASHDLLQQLISREIPSPPILTDLAKLPQPFMIRRPPSGPYTTLFQPFSTTRSTTSSTAAWALKSPFDPYPGAKWQLVREASSGAQSYSEIYTTYERHGAQHISAGVGIGIGNAVLGANVSVQYDKTVTENSDGIKISKKSLVKSGVLTYGNLEEEQPKLSLEGRNILERDVLDETTHFKDTYGDCFVGGLLIGAEAGVLFSQDNYEKTTVQVATITLKIKVLFATFKKAWSVTDVDHEALSSFSITTFNTMNNSFSCLAPGLPAPDGKDTVEAAAIGIQAVDELMEVIEEKLEALMKGANEDSHAMAEKLLKAGLILEVMLVPYASLVDFVEVMEAAKEKKRVAAIAAEVGRI